jgi:transcriptional regulator with XRE-family HTH domain
LQLKEWAVPKRIEVRSRGEESFGDKLARIRKAAGFTQRELARELGISQRMVAYYEGQTEHPPTKLLPEIARVLRVSTDELLGLESGAAPRKRQPDTRLLRRLKQIEELPAPVKRQLIQVIDTFIERERLAKRADASRAAR